MVAGKKRKKQQKRAGMSYVLTFCWVNSWFVDHMTILFCYFEVSFFVCYSTVSTVIDRLICEFIQFPISHHFFSDKIATEL